MNQINSKDAQNQTIPIEYTESGNLPMEYFEKSTQTNSKYLVKIKNSPIFVDEKIVEMLIESLLNLEKEEQLFAQFDNLRKHEKIALIPRKVVQIQMLEKLPIVGLEYGFNNQVAILFGERRHIDTWCMHSVGRLLVYQKNKFASPIYLASCATKAVFAPQNQVIVATALGEILVTYEGDILWVTSAFHIQYVTGLLMPKRNRLISIGLDGRLTLSKLNSNGSLELLKQTTVTLNDLPRILRKSNATTQNAGLVSISGFNDEIYIAGETGAIWKLDLKELNVQNVGYEQEGVEQLIALENEFVYSTSQGDLKRKRKGVQSETLNGLKAEIPFSFQNLNLLICFSDGKTVNGFDFNNQEIILNENHEFLAYGINPVNGDLAAINNHYQIVFYNFSNNL